MLTTFSTARAVSRFHASETGAVTVDWVVLCALVTGLTIAMYDEVGAALGFHSDNVTEELTNSEIVRAGAENSIGFDFTTGGSGRWSGASVTEVPGFGSVLGPIGGSEGYASVTHDFIMASDVDVSYITFDLLAIDSLDNESAFIYINGEKIGELKVGANSLTFLPTDAEGVESNYEVVAQGVDLGGMSSSTGGVWDDDIVNIQIAVTDPGDVLSFGVGSNADQDTYDESFAIDNFSISGVDVEATTSAGGNADS